MKVVALSRSRNGGGTLSRLGQKLSDIKSRWLGLGQGFSCSCVLVFLCLGKMFLIGDNISEHCLHSNVFFSANSIPAIPTA